MKKIITIDSKEALLDSFWDEDLLKGYKAEPGMDTKKFNYPIQFELDTKAKTFKVYVKPVEKKVEKESKKTFAEKLKDHCGWVFFGVAFLAIIAIAISTFEL